MTSDAREPQYSVVVPVYDEADVIGTWCRQAVAMLPGDPEVLVVHDFQEDSTLAALEALPSEEKPAGLRTVLNEMGKGVRYAIEVGLRSARAPVVVVMMADGADDFSKVAELVDRAQGGADVVCASRYVKGGRQVGGPWFKGLLSRTAGVTLRWFAGVPTHDATNSFKAYRREFLERTEIESEAGFCLGMELTVKAHFGGGRVEEVPATWHDRTAGESRFRVFAWLPHYLHWYFWALRRRWLGSPD